MTGTIEQSKRTGASDARADDSGNLVKAEDILTPEELAEFIDSLEYDQTPAAVAECTDYDPEQ